jgi:hypothetical protein
MAGQIHSPRRGQAASRFDPWDETAVALMVIDELPLKSAAWAELHSVRKRQEKAARDLHRHEEIDRPEYDAWLHRTFPTVITLLRELHEEVYAKGQRVHTVQTIAAMTGRSPRKIWLEHKEAEANAKANSENESANHKDRGDFGDADEFDDDDDFFGDDPRDARRSKRQQWDDMFDVDFDFPSAPKATAEVKDIYRRLVQRIHPDRGGEWTAARQRLWHEVQQAWAAGDVDWLTRLEVEWETANDVLTPSSPLSRLRCAIAELHAARRDIERKLRDYRGSPPWRFSLSEKKREDLYRRTDLNFRHDIDFLQRQLTHLNALIASWEKPVRRRTRARARSIEVRFFE